MSKEIENLCAKADYYKVRWPVYSDMVDWLMDLLVETFRTEIQIPIPNTIFEITTVTRNLGMGIPLFDMNIFPLDLNITRKLYHILVKKTENHRKHQLTGFDSILSGSEHEIEKMLRGVLKSDVSMLQSVCKKSGVDTHAVEFILKLALRPNLIYLSRSAAEIDLSPWSYGHCPVCGAYPILSEFSKDKSDRALYCSLCETSWTYPRFRCPFCENEQSEDMSYLYADEEEDFRVDFCARCKQGLKTVNLQETGYGIIPILDDLISTHLTIAIEGNK